MFVNLSSYFMENHP